MMRSSSLLIVALGMFAGLPPVSHAYMEPEEVLFDDGYRYYDPPASTRETRQNYEEQEAERARNRAQQNSSASVDEELHGAAPEDEAATEEDALSPTGEELTPEEKRNERLLQRIEDNQLDANFSGALSDEVLHSGAPLADTGSGTTLAFLILSSAALWILLRAGTKQATRTDETLG